MSTRHTNEERRTGLSEVFSAIGACEAGTVDANDRRRAEPKPSSTLSLRLSAEERARLETSAAGLSLSAYVRQRLFEGGGTPRRVSGRAPIKDHVALARVLRSLGRSELMPDLQALSVAEQTGALVTDEATARALRQACADVAAMRRDLVKALGLRA